MLSISFTTVKQIISFENNSSSNLELIHDQLPLAVPCYDLLLVTELTLVLNWIKPLGTSSSPELTGGEYKRRERIHRGLADPRLLAIPASCGRVAAHNLNWRKIWRIGSGLLRRDPLFFRLYYVCSPRCQGTCWPGVILSFLPRKGAVSCDTYNTRRGLRSLPHWREQFKPRTDDGHASPVYYCLAKDTFLYRSIVFLILVRFFVHHRIKPHNPLLVRLPVYSFEF